MDLRAAKVLEVKRLLNQLIQSIGDDFVSFCTEEGYAIDLSVFNNGLYIDVRGENRKEEDYNVNPIPYFKDI